MYFDLAVARERGGGREGEIAREKEEDEEEESGTNSVQAASLAEALCRMRNFSSGLFM